ncbi:hypothetical protein [Paraburkholderia fynbosensis]|uniref:hypothetical protein n=1 Tax=Paraburkholderia fynbosensis TaxID=1200993 RepID=UPI001581DA4F|nr:hypothetical protein [Paraburkholderia fynbosensis]
MAAIAALLVAAGAHADNHKKKDHAAQMTPAASAPVAAAPTGPVGFGALKLGMTRESVEALSANDGFYLTESLKPEASRFPPPNGGERFKALALTPLGPNPEKVSLTFTEGVLTAFSVTLDDATFEQARQQLVAKYGPGQQTDDRKDEQCIYRNGANFKINWGSVASRWVQDISPTEQVKSSATEFTVDMCPPSLDGPRLGASTTRFIVMEKVHVDATPKANVF